MEILELFLGFSKKVTFFQKKQLIETCSYELKMHLWHWQQHTMDTAVSSWSKYSKQQQKY